ncbi:MAG: Asp-tRNA(Asn)/Glu-tRNA(Gln) amidotransferase subunit GatA [SAR202 cluster bacterium]|nr:Asp-tRNA(Asn)/Glu-tRNA(Gln) amidotransferase subunit GatA [SAR202 cluster bacterium]
MTTAIRSLTDMSIAELGKHIKAKQVSPVEVMEATLARAQALQPKINAFITLTPERAMAAAHAAETEILNGKYRGPLHGIPLGVKDLVATKGVPTSSGAYFEKDHIPSEDATVVARLTEAGAIGVGKTSTVQFAYGSIEHDARFGDARNPWNTGRVTTGSSTGSAAAVAARVVPLAIGTDTGGSIRMPSASCGITGIKPTFGLVSRFGVTGISWSLDHVGPMTRSALDCAIALNVFVGHDPRDASTVQRPKTDYTRGIRNGIDGMRVGVPWDYIRPLWDGEVETAFLNALKTLESLGARVEEVKIPELDQTDAMFPVISGVEVAEMHRDRLKAHAKEYHQDIRRRIETGFFVPATAYVHAQRLRRGLGRKFAQVFQTYQLLATPANLVPAFPIGQKLVTVRGKEVHHVELVLRMMRIYNINGVPAVSLPAGFSRDGLPLSLQLAGKWFDDPLVLRAAHAFQQATDHHLRKPEL